MKKIIVVLGVLAVSVAGCSSGSGVGTASQRVVLDVRCGADADCPSGFECEDEREHGALTTYCVSHNSDSAAASECPAGYELEVEHSETFCKPHGGGGSQSGGSQGTPSGEGCATDADCASGLECEIETEHGVTFSFCKAHGGNG